MTYAWSDSNYTNFLAHLATNVLMEDDPDDTNYLPELGDPQGEHNVGDLLQSNPISCETKGQSDEEMTDDLHEEIGHVTQIVQAWRLNPESPNVP